MAFELDLSGQTALVTGGGQGVGRGIATALGRAGAEVAVNDIVEARAMEVVKEIHNSGGTAQPAVFDVTDRADVQAAIEAIGGVDILVNNAGNAGVEGFAAMRPFVMSDPSEWDRYIRVNLYGVMNCTHAVLPGMIDRSRGRVITVISDAGRFGDANLAPYAAAKAGAAGFSRSVAREVGRFGITVNCVALATIRTPTTSQTEGGDDEERARALRRYIIRRQGEPEDVAGLVTYLASPLASWVTGQTYPVNGGYTLTL